jgi:hypothetical protein
VDGARKATTLWKAANFIFYLAQIYAHFGDADLAFETMQELIDAAPTVAASCAQHRYDTIRCGTNPQRSALRQSDRLTRSERGEVACSEVLLGF